MDTNILLYFLNDESEVVEMLSEKSVVISFITELELLSFPKITKDSEKVIKGLLKNCTIVNIPAEVKNLVIEFRKNARLKLPDAIIAATAYYLKLPLLTADKDFKRVEGLDIVLYQV